MRGKCFICGGFIARDQQLHTCCCEYQEDVDPPAPAEESAILDAVIEAALGKVTWQ